MSLSPFTFSELAERIAPRLNSYSCVVLLTAQDREAYRVLLKRFVSKDILILVPKHWHELKDLRADSTVLVFADGYDKLPEWMREKLEHMIGVGFVAYDLSTVEPDPLIGTY